MKKKKNFKKNWNHTGRPGALRFLAAWNAGSSNCFLRWLLSSIGTKLALFTIIFFPKLRAKNSKNYLLKKRFKSHLWNGCNGVSVAERILANVGNGTDSFDAADLSYKYQIEEKKTKEEKIW